MIHILIGVIGRRRRRRFLPKQAHFKRSYTVEHGKKLVEYHERTLEVGSLTASMASPFTRPPHRRMLD
ncbi:hypothetical protein K1719_000982 [Acacia pycnantha]|nr:hypothetical protein K1719_000982 [Acacia pycnantha]